MASFSKNDLPAETDRIGTLVVDVAYAVHREMGPGLLESIYESCMVKELQKREILFERQKSVSIYYREELLDEKLRLDLMIGEKVVVEVKAAEELMPSMRLSF